MGDVEQGAPSIKNKTDNEVILQTATWKEDNYQDVSIERPPTTPYDQIKRQRELTSSQIIPTRPLENPIASLVPEFANDNACTEESRREKTALQ